MSRPEMYKKNNIFFVWKGGKKQRKQKGKRRKRKRSEMCGNRGGLVRKRRMRKTMKTNIFFIVKAATIICALF